MITPLRIDENTQKSEIPLQESNTLFLVEYETKSLWISDTTLINLKNFCELKKYKSKSISYRKIIKNDKNASKVFVEITASHYLGLIKIDSYLSIVIVPKISNANFIKMLHYVFPERIKSWDFFVNGIKKDENFIVSFLKHFFNQILTLLREYNRKNYSIHNENSLIPHGSINLRQSIKNFHKFPPRVKCYTFRFDIDTPHNQIIKYTLIYLKPIIFGELESIHRKILQKLSDVSYKSWNSQEIQNISYSRLDKHYLPVHKMCRLLLEDFSLLFEKGQSSFFCFLINSWNIFERFLYRIFELYQDYYELSSYSLYLVDENHSNQEKEIKYLPDIVLSKNNVPEIIIDAKYKIPSSYRNDIAQMNLYTGKINQQVGFLIYPSDKTINNPSKFDFKKKFLKQHGFKKCIFCIFLDLSIVNDVSKLKIFVASIIKFYKEMNENLVS